MQPIPFKQANTIYKLEGCSDLPTFVGEEVIDGLPYRSITSVWQLTTEELIAVLNTGKIALTVIASGQPPVRLAVVDE